MNARTFTTYVRIRPLLLQKFHCHLRPFLGVFGLAVTHHCGEETIFALWQWSLLDKTDEHAYYHRALQWLILKYQDKCKLESVWAHKLETFFDRQMTSVSRLSRIPLPNASCNQRFGVWLLVLVFFFVLLQCLNDCQSWCIFNLGRSITNISCEVCFQVIFSQNCVEMDRFHMWKEMPLLIVPCLPVEISCWYILTLYTIKIYIYIYVRILSSQTFELHLNNIGVIHLHLQHLKCNKNKPQPNSVALQFLPLFHPKVGKHW